MVAFQASRNPGAAAITAPDITPLRYQGLLEQIRQVIAKLNAIAVGGEERLAIALPNGPGMAIALLAIAHKIDI